MRYLTLLLSAAFVFNAGAKNLKAEVNLDHDLWWEAPEVPCVILQVTDTLGQSNFSKLTLRVTSDRNEAVPLVKTDRYVSITKPYGQEMKYYLNFSAPGFYKCFVEDEGNVIKQFNIGYEPTLTFSLPDSKPDFDQFWTTALEELAAVPGEYSVVEDPSKSGKLRKAYKVSMKSWGGETIKGYLYVPVNEGKYPAQIYYNGYGAQPWEFDVDGRPDWIEFVSSVRGQMYSQPENTYGDWIRYNLDKPAEYYYKGAYLDAVRAIDFVAQLDKTDTDLIFAEGGSQGGALTLAAAALDNRLAGIAPYIPFLSDFKDYFKIVDWPASAVFEEQKQLGISDTELYNNLSYFDIKNFARNIKAPVMMGIGLQDPTCPPHTNMASYTLIKSPKELIIYPTLGHTVDYSDWNPRRDRFFAGIIDEVKLHRQSDNK